MSDEAETPAQRQLRIRQQKREAKLKASGQERLDKITKLSGRTPESLRNEANTSSPAAAAAAAATPPAPSALETEDPTNPPIVLPSLSGQTNDAEQLRIQQEYIRAMLSGTPRDPSANMQQGEQLPPGEEDPMVKMLQSMLGGMSGDPNAPAGMPSADDLSKMTGMPPFVANMLFGNKQQTQVRPEDVKLQSIWKSVRILVSILVGVYMIFTIEKSIDLFGHNPPTPATIQNPFVVFLTSELLLYGTRATLSSRPIPSGFKAWIQSGRDFARDGAILIFMLGLYSWSKGLT